MNASTLRFSKMHALCNDFVVVDATQQQCDISPATVSALADRRSGIGFDQLLVVSKSKVKGTADFYLTIYNSDGGIAEQCGNGTLCVTRFLLDRQLSTKSEVAIQTAGGLLSAKVVGNSKDGDLDVELDMGIPVLNPADIPFEASGTALQHELDLFEEALGCVVVTPVSMGNPHAVVFDVDIDDERVERFASAIQTHERFPESANVEFVERVDRHTLRMRVIERGAGETMACGTGACAAAVAAQQRGLTGKKVSVKQPGGTAMVAWEGLGERITLTAPASHSFDGEVSLD